MKDKFFNLIGIEYSEDTIHRFFWVYDKVSKDLAIELLSHPIASLIASLNQGNYEKSKIILNDLNNKIEKNLKIIDLAISKNKVSLK